jgi:hypothetical protein
MFEQIHEIVFYGENYDWNTVYHFPIWLRNFTYNQILEYHKKQKEQTDVQNNVVTAENIDKILAKPQITPPNSYIVNKDKAPKK